MLTEIAEADYSTDIAEHLAALLPTRDSGVMPPLAWHPVEVLGLIRWSEPGEADWKPGAAGERGHVMRAFACAVLLRMAAEAENQDHDFSENDTLIQLIDSAMALGPEVTEAAARFVAWRRSLLPDDTWNHLVFDLGLILLSAAPQPQSQDETRLAWLADRILADNVRLEDEFQYSERLDRSEFLLSSLLRGLEFKRWTLVARDLAGKNEPEWPEELKSKLMTIGRLMEGPLESDP